MNYSEALLPACGSDLQIVGELRFALPRNGGWTVLLKLAVELRKAHAELVRRNVSFPVSLNANSEVSESDNAGAGLRA